MSEISGSYQKKKKSHEGSIVALEKGAGASASEPAASRTSTSGVSRMQFPDRRPETFLQIKVLGASFGARVYRDPVLFGI